MVVDGNEDLTEHRVYNDHFLIFFLRVQSNLSNLTVFWK